MHINELGIFLAAMLVTGTVVQPTFNGMQPIFFNTSIMSLDQVKINNEFVSEYKFNSD